MPPRKKAYEARHRAEDAKPDAVRPTVTEEGSTPTRRRKPQHSGPAAPRKKAAPKAPEVPGTDDRRQRRRDAAIDEARNYANRTALRATTGKPSVVGRAAAGGAAGAATGAAVAGPPGAVAGGVIGTAGGAIAGRKAKKAYQAAMRASPGTRRIIVAEFMVCMVIVALSPLTDRKREEAPADFMKRMAAIMGVFFVLGLVSAAGRNAAKGAAGFGGLVTVALAVSSRDVFMKLGTLFDSSARQGARVDRGDEDELGDRQGRRSDRPEDVQWMPQ